MDRQTEIRETLTAALGAIDDDRSPLDLVAEIPMIESATADIIAERVGAARAQGLSWEAIALRMGISRQAAHKRFGKSSKRKPKPRSGLRVQLRVERQK